MISFHIVKSKKDIDDVSNLISVVYQKTGYISSDSNQDDILEQIKKHIYFDDDYAVTILVRLNSNGRLLGTISVVCDGADGLPMDNEYRDALKVMRDKHCKLSEIRRFAIDSDYVKDLSELSDNKKIEFDISLGLLGLAIKYNIKKSIDNTCFMIKSEHRGLYESIGAVKIGEERKCEAINCMPVLAYVINLSEIESNKTNFVTQKILDTEVPVNFFNN